MKLWAKTIGLNQILLITLTTLLVNQFFGNFPVNLPTLVRGIHFVETPLTNLLATVIPSVVYYNRSKMAFPLAQSTKRLSPILESLLFPITMALVICSLFLALTSPKFPCAFIEYTIIFGASAEIYFWLKPKMSPFIPICVFLVLALAGHWLH